MFQQSSITPSSSTLQGAMLGVSKAGTHTSPPHPQTSQQVRFPPPWQHVLGHVGKLGGRGAPE